MRSWPEGRKEKKGDLEPNTSLPSRDYSAAALPVTSSLHFIQHILIFLQELR